jgi:hypothetical protein
MNNIFIRSGRVKSINAAGSILLEKTVKNTLSKFGLCATCRHFMYTLRRAEMGKCNYYDENYILSPGDPVLDCTQFYPRGQMTLFEMRDISYIIDIHEKQVGFTNVERTVTIKEPKDNNEE